VVEIRRIDEVTLVDAPVFGSKAAHLGELARKGLRVPPGICIAASVYEAHAERCGLREALSVVIRRRDWAEAEKTAAALLHGQPLDEELVAVMADALDRIGGAAFAVRSSAIAEDQPGASFAGQYLSVLNVSRGKEVHGARVDCWASLWSRAALDYRDRRSLDQWSGGMAVLFQAMVPADVSGVLFSIDPVEERSDRILVEAVSGLGETLVSGRKTDALYRVDRAGLRVVDRDGESSLVPSDALTELCRDALTVEKDFGFPQDIEFAISQGETFLLQARPITTLGRVTAEPIEPLGPPSFLDRMMKPLVADRYVIAPRPLDNITYTRCVGAAIHSLRRAGAVITPEAEASFRTEIWRQAYRFPPHRLTWRILFAGWRELRLLRTDWTKWWESDPGPSLRAAAQPVDVTALDTEALFRRAEQILKCWEQPLNERIYITSAYRTEVWLNTLVRLAVGRRESDRVMADLLSGLQHPTLEANAALWELAGKARVSPAISKALRELDPKALECTDEGRTFARELEDFLELYGHREGSCWYLSTPTWKNDPMRVWRLLRSTMEVEEPPTDHETATTRYRDASQLVNRRLRYLPGLGPAFRWLLAAIRSLTTFRELSHFDLTRSLSTLQTIAREWGRRLEASGTIGSADDVYYLTYDEVRDWLLGELPDPTHARDLVMRRRATYQEVNARWQAERAGATDGAGELKGIATSPGAVMGRVRVIRGEDQFDRLHEGEILVCRYTNPAWTPLFAVAAAVVTETGGTASHAAIVAREYGIPAVMAVSNATASLSDGDQALVDGTRGIVQLVEG